MQQNVKNVKGVNTFARHCMYQEQEMVVWHLIVSQWSFYIINRHGFEQVSKSKMLGLYSQVLFIKTVEDPKGHIPTIFW